MKQRQRSTLEHWTELSRSSWRVEGMRLWAKRSRPWGFIHWNSLPELMGAHQLQLDWEGTSIGPLDVVDSCMAGTDWGPTGSGTGIYLYYICWLFGILFSLDVYLVQPRYSREGLRPFPKQCALPSLRIRWGWFGRMCGGKGRSRGSGSLDWYFFLTNLINLKNFKSPLLVSMSIHVSEWMCV